MKRTGWASGMLAVTLLMATSLSTPRAQVDDSWPQWRGPNRDGHSRDTGLLQSWPAAGPPLVWKASGAGHGYSSMAVVGGRLYTLGARENTEYLMAYDASSGKKLWETASGRRFSNDRGDGPRSTPTIEGQRIYALGGSGDLVAADLQTGKVIWTVNVLKQFGGSNPNWGISESPLIVGDRILVNAGGKSASLVAFSKSDGKVIWKVQDDPAAYSSAVTTRAAGINQAVFFTAWRAIGVDVQDGRYLWSYEKVSNRTANIATPIVAGDRVFLSSDYGTGCVLLKLSGAGGTVNATEVYFNRNMRNHYSSSVLVGQHLYGFSSAILTAMGLDNGEVAWRDRSVGKGSLVFADKRLYLFSEDGVVGLAEAVPDAYREVGRFKLPALSGTTTWTHPVVSGGRLYLRDQDSIFAYNVKGS